MVLNRRCSILRNRLLFPLVLALALSTLVQVPASPGKSEPAAVGGVLDLRNRDFRKDGPVELNGEWEFYWETLVPADAVSRGEAPVPAGVIRVPGYWSEVSVEGRPLPGKGFATLHLKVLLPETDRIFAVKVKEIQTACILFADGREVSRAGRVGTDAASSIPRYASLVSTILPKGREVDFVLHVSNFHHREGGIWEGIRFGLEEDIRRNHENRLMFELFITGSIIIMGLYHLGLFLLRRKDRTALFFGLFCCVIAIRAFTTGELYMYRMFPGFPWQIIHRLEYLSYYLGLPLFLTYLFSLFPRIFSVMVLRTVSLLAGGFTLLVLSTPSSVYTYSVQTYQVITILSGIYSLYVLLRAIREKEQGAVILASGFLVMFLAVINDVLHSNQIVHTGFFMPLGLFIFIFSQSYLIARRFTLMFATVELSRIAIILGLAKLAEYRDMDTGLHLERIREYGKLIAQELSLHPDYRGYITERYINDLFHSSILHDIGKVGVPDSILLKPGSLTPDEFDIIKRHATIGGDAISDIESKMNMKSFLTLGKEIAYYHHEKWDGTGYPKGLRETAIPLSARIVALADVYDALTSERPYKKAMSHKEASAVILEGRAKHFDPLIVDIFLARNADFDRIRLSFRVNTGRREPTGSEEPMSTQAR